MFLYLQRALEEGNRLLNGGGKVDSAFLSGRKSHNKTTMTRVLSYIVLQQLYVILLGIPKVA